MKIKSLKKALYILSCCAILNAQQLTSDRGINFLITMKVQQ
tara:strand:+ start:5625 stop:5747 length:123 start_codon:yes stop_codon:yes gene_type:complete